MFFGTANLLQICNLCWLVPKTTIWPFWTPPYWSGSTMLRGAAMLLGEWGPTQVIRRP